MIVIEPVDPLGQITSLVLAPGQMMTQAQRTAAIARAQELSRQAYEERQAREERIERQYAIDVQREPTTPLEVEARRRVTTYEREEAFHTARRSFESELSRYPLATRRKVTDLMKYYDSYEALPGYADFNAGRRSMAQIMPGILDLSKQIEAQQEEERAARDQLPGMIVGASPIPGSQARQWWASTDRERAEWGVKAMLAQLGIRYTRGKTIITTEQADQILEATLLGLQAVASDPAFVEDASDLRNMQRVMSMISADLLSNMGISVGLEGPDWQERAEFAVNWWVGRTPGHEQMDSNRYAEYFRQVADTAMRWWETARDSYIRRGGVVDSPHVSIVRRYVDNLLRQSITVEVVPTEAERQQAIRDLMRAESAAEWEAELAAHPKQPGSPPVIRAIAQISDQMGIIPGPLDTATYNSLRSAVYNLARQFGSEFYYYERHQAGKRYYKTDRITVSRTLTEEGYTKATATRPAVIGPAVIRPAVTTARPRPITSTTTPNDPMIQAAIQEAMSEARLESGMEVTDIAAFERLVMEKAAALTETTRKRARAADVENAIRARMRFILEGIAI